VGSDAEGLRKSRVWNVVSGEEVMRGWYRQVGVRGRAGDTDRTWGGPYSCAGETLGNNERIEDTFVSKENS
jgi:hypothetical protein